MSYRFQTFSPGWKICGRVPETLKTVDICQILTLKRQSSVCNLDFLPNLQYGQMKETNLLICQRFQVSSHLLRTLRRTNLRQFSIAIVKILIFTRLTPSTPDAKSGLSLLCLFVLFLKKISKLLRATVLSLAAKFCAIIMFHSLRNSRKPGRFRATLLISELDNSCPTTK